MEPLSDAKTKFSIEIEKIKVRSPDVTYIEIIADYCERNDIDLHIVPRLITVSLKQKISNESKIRHLIEDNTEHFSMDNLL